MNANDRAKQVFNNHINVDISDILKAVIGNASNGVLETEIPCDRYSSEQVKVVIKKLKEEGLEVNHRVSNDQRDGYNYLEVKVNLNK